MQSGRTAAIKYTGGLTVVKARLVWQSLPLALATGRPRLYNPAWRHAATWRRGMCDGATQAKGGRDWPERPLAASGRNPRDMAETALTAAEGDATNAAERRKIRVLVAKPGLDGHDRGAKVIARALRDAGMEVIYTGIRQTPQMIVEGAIQEDVDAILMSILSGAHMAIFPKVMELLRASGVDDVLVMAGGILPDEDIPTIEAMGIRGNFGPGTPMSTIIEYVRANVRPERLSQELPPLATSGGPIEPVENSAANAPSQRQAE